MGKFQKSVVPQKGTFNAPHHTYFSLNSGLSDFYTFSFSGCPIQFYTFQNFPKMVKFYNIKIPLTHYFHLLFQIYHLNINGSHHFTYFPFSFSLLYITLYTFLNLRVQKKRIDPKGTEEVQAFGVTPREYLLVLDNLDCLPKGSHLAFFGQFLFKMIAPKTGVSIPFI